MNDKTRMAVFCGVILLFTIGLCRADPVPRKPVAAKSFEESKAIKEIVVQVDELASNGIVASVVFARELTKVLSAHKVPLPDKLSRLKSPKPPVPDYDEMTESIYEPTHKIHELCANSIWVKDPNYVVPVPLRNELLAAIASHCPNSGNRFESARWLGECITNPGKYPRVPLRLINQATVSAINHIINRASEGKFSGNKSAIVAYGLALVTNHIALESMLAEKPTKETLDKILAEYASKTDALLEAAKDEKLVIALTKAKQGFKRFEGMTEIWAKVSAVKKGLEPVVKGFVDAVNKEDKKAASKYLTKKMAESLLKKESLRDAIWPMPQNFEYRKVKKVEYLVLGNPSGGSIKNGNVTVDSIQVHLRIIYYQGKSKQIVRYLPVVLTPNGWLIGTNTK